MTVAYTFTRIADFGRALALSRARAVNERLPREQVSTLQRTRLTKLVRLAAARSPLYAELYRGLDLSRPIEIDALPCTDKRMLMGRFDDWITDRRLRLGELDEHLESVEGDDLHLGEYRVCATGGTSGRRGVFVFSRREWIEAMAGFFRQSELVGITPRLPRRRIAVVAATRAVHMTARFGLFADVGLHRIHRFDARTPVRELAAALHTFAPDALIGYPSVLALLAEEQLAGKLRIAPSIVATSSETRTPEMEARMRSAWSCVPFDEYASTETGFLAVDCLRHLGRHLFEDQVIVENVDERGQPVPDGTVGHRLLVTNLWNHTQPLIRYELSDMATIDAAPCACGRTFRRIVALEGRSDDILQLAGAGGEPIAVHPLTLRSPFTGIGEILQYQILFDGSTLLVRAVPNGAVAADLIERRVCGALGAKLAEIGVVPPEIRVVTVAALTRDGGPTGKLKLIQIVRPGTGLRCAD